MIIASNFDKEFIISREFTINPQDEIVQADLETALSEYTSPAQGFKTSFVAEELEKKGYKIIELIDEEMENSPEDRVY